MNRYCSKHNRPVVKIVPMFDDTIKNIQGFGNYTFGTDSAVFTTISSHVMCDLCYVTHLIDESIKSRRYGEAYAR